MYSSRIDEASTGNVSLFRSCFDKIPGETISIESFFTGYSESRKRRVEMVRACQDKDEQRKTKLRLPAITPAGVFTVRRTNCLLRYSGYAGIDLDNLEGRTDYIKDKLSGFPGLAYCGLSVSGTGLFALIRLATPEQYESHLESIFADFSSMGLYPDPACKDITRLRIVSYDLNPIINFSVSPYRKLSAHPAEKTAAPQQLHGDAIAVRVEKCIRQIIERQIDLTSDYSTWIVLAYAIGNQFGEAGRSYFHEVSQFYPNYDRGETDRTYTACLRGSSVNIGTFFYHCKRAGIYW
ncbi:MAG: PriCT-2 domain-containing protein [Bacteroidales bacterium]|nr:PriCT-2 domain-containing protein [Bacteroidales bacterium]